MAVQIKVNPTYTGTVDPNCTYKWCWYVDGTEIRCDVGTSPNVDPLELATAAPLVPTVYNVQLIIKENTLAADTVCSSSIVQTTVQPTICDGLCDEGEGGEGGEGGGDNILLLQFNDINKPIGEKSCPVDVTVTSDNVEFSGNTPGGAFQMAAAFVASAGSGEGEGEGEGEGGGEITGHITLVADDSSVCANDPLCWDGEFTVDFWFNLENRDELVAFLMSKEFDPNYPNGYDAPGVVQIVWGGKGHAMLPDYHLIALVGDDAGSANIVDGSSIVANNTWHHFAITRDSSNIFYIFLDGTLMTTSTTNAGTLKPSTNDGYVIGRAQGDSIVLEGPFKIDDFRIVKGTAEWTSTFPIPTGPHSC